jgi:exonuclease III
MKIISWNVAGRVRKQQLQLDALISREPDVVGLQEVTIKTLPLWMEGFKKEGYANVISSFDLQGAGNNELTGPRRYGILVASRWPLDPVDQRSLKIPWQERLLSILIHSPNVDFEFHVAYIPPGSSNGWLKIDTFEGIYKFLAKPSCNYPRILCGDFNSPKAETSTGEVITWGQKLFKDGQIRFSDKEGRWDAGERSVLQGLAEYNLYDIFRLLNGYKVQEFSWLLRRKGKIIARRRFDHIFAEKTLSPVACHYIHPFREESLSDHSAVEATFKI